jgi:Tol biopolymer transport system component
VPWVIAAAALAWAVAASLDRSPPSDPIPQMRVDIVTRSPLAGLGSSLTLTPDGSRLIYVEGGDDSHDLLMRPLDGGEPTLLASGNSASLSPIHAFLSPDGKWVGFVTMTELKKVPLSGGPPLRICGVTRSRGATWLPDDTIVFAPTFDSGLMRVKASGGEPQRLTELDAASGEIAHRWPYALPDGDHILFSSHHPGGATPTVEVVSIATGERKVVHRGGAFPRYVPTGYLVFVNADKLFAAPFDLRTLELGSAPVPVLEGVATADMYGSALFAFSANGLLAYVARAPQSTSYPIAWVDRDGATSPLLGVAGAYASPQLSPDGRRLALTVLRDDNWDIWVHDLERGVATRLTFDPSSETEQVWSPDGRHLIFSSDREGSDSLYRKRADGSGESERLTTPEKPHWASSWSRDGRYVAYVEAADFYDIGYLDLETRETRTILATPYGELYPDISPDGRWLAYASNESGVYAIYVVPFPSGEGRWQVSNESGSNPRWSGDGRELFWRTDEGIVVASVDTADGSFRAGKVRKLFEGPFHGGALGVEISGLSLGDYAVSSDGQRFVMFPDSEWAARGNHTHITLVTRWFDQLARAVASDAK